MSFLDVLPDCAEDVRRRCIDSGSTWVHNSGVYSSTDGLVFSEDGKFVSTEEIGNSEIGAAFWLKNRLKACAVFGALKGYQLSPDHSHAQNAAIALALGSKTSAIVGGPGTGKTHVLRRIIEKSGLSENDIALCSFTAAAAKRMSVSTGLEGRTIHRTLRVTAEGRFFYNRTNPLPYRLVIVDETSTLDIVLANALLRAIPTNCAVIFVGDDDQFPSIGPGNFFADLLSVVPSVKLKTIYRSEPDGLIATECRAIINHGKTIARAYDKRNGKCFAKVDTESTKDSANKAAEIIDYLAKNGISSADDSRILCPFWDGIDSINKSEKVQSLYDYIPYLCTKNDYKANVLNGELGKGRKNGGKLAVFDSGSLPVDCSTVKKSYAQTVFSAQGNEWETVVFIVPHSPANKKLDRACPYVGVSRAKKSAFIVGDIAAYRDMVRREPANRKRHTMFLKIVSN